MGLKGACPSVSSQAEVKKIGDWFTLSTCSGGQPNSQKGPSTPDGAGTNTKRTNTRQKWTQEDYIEVTFCYHKAKHTPVKV